MGTILLLDEDDSRAREIVTKVADAAPEMAVRRVRTGVELRYEAACHPPQLVILGTVSSSHSARRLAWEMRALRPCARIVALARDDFEERELRTLGESLTVVGLARSDAVLEITRVCQRLRRTASAAVRPPVTLDSHRFKNRVAGLLAGMHAFAAELRATAHDANQVHAIADEYVDRLTSVVADISAMVAASQSAAAQEHEG